MSFDKISSEQKVAPVKVGEVKNASTVKEKLASLPEQLMGKVQGRSITTFFDLTFASVEKKIDRAADHFIAAPLEPFFKKLDTVSAKILSNVPQKFFNISDSLRVTLSKAPEMKTVDLITFKNHMDGLQEAIKQLSNAVLTKSPDVEVLKKSLESKVNEAKKMRSEDKNMNKLMQEGLAKAAPFLNSPNLSRAALDFKGGTTDFIKDLGNFNISIFGGNVLIDNKLDLSTLKSWYLNNNVLGAFNKENQQAFKQLNGKIGELVKFCGDSHPLYSPFIQKDAEDPRGFTTAIPTTSATRTAHDVLQMRQNAKAQIQNAIDQVKKMSQEIEAISFEKSPMNQGMADIGDYTKGYLQSNCNKLLRNLEGIKAQLSPPSQRSPN